MSARMTIDEMSLMAECSKRIAEMRKNGEVESWMEDYETDADAKIVDMTYAEAEMLYDLGHVFHSRHSVLAVREENRDLLQLFLDKGIPWYTGICSTAVSFSDFETFKWICENHNVIDRRVIKKAATSLDPDKMNYFIERGMGYMIDAGIVITASQYESLEVLKLLQRRGYKIPMQALDYAEEREGEWIKWRENLKEEDMTEGEEDDDDDDDARSLGDVSSIPYTEYENEDEDEEFGIREEEEE